MSTLISHLESTLNLETSRNYSQDKHLENRNRREIESLAETGQYATLRILLNADSLLLSLGPSAPLARVFRIVPTES